jgi:hypothetical protein
MRMRTGPNPLHRMRRHDGGARELAIGWSSSTVAVATRHQRASASPAPGFWKGRRPSAAIGCVQSAASPGRSSLLRRALSGADGARPERSSRTPRRGRPRVQAIANVEAARGNAARVVSTPMLALPMQTPGRESPSRAELFVRSGCLASTTDVRNQATALVLGDGAHPLLLHPDVLVKPACVRGGWSCAARRGGPLTPSGVFVPAETVKRGCRPARRLRCTRSSSPRGQLVPTGRTLQRELRGSAEDPPHESWRIPWRADRRATPPGRSQAPAAQ